ncbi:MAG: carboxymuconolactone decarboxylase family protein [Silicimonas sp.]|nr:carboxymuconolactone decarboxylase family protein [Silicimonas sp.]
MAVNPAALAGFFKVKTAITKIDAGLRALLEVRISQINGCAHCVDTHLAEARAEGETQQRIDCLAVWRESPFFTPTERAALAWVEAVTLLPSNGAPDTLYDDLRAHFTDEEVVDITMIVALMNSWNRLAVGFRHMPKQR